MANFDMAELALKSVCPNNAMKYDDKEMPSIMVFIPKFRLCDVLSTADTSVHPAFRVNGVEIDGFWVGKYQTSHYNGRAYSLPGENPANTAGFDTFVSYNRAKGGKFHEITCAEWAAITVTPEINAFIEAAVKELDLAEKNAIGEIGKIFSDAEQTPQN